MKDKFRHSWIVRRALPVGSRRRARVVRLLKGQESAAPSTSISYQEWIEDCEPRLFAMNAEKLSAARLRPRISIVVPCYNTPDKYLGPLVDSIIAQTYDNWQLCISDGSTDVSRAKAIKHVCELDDRITYTKVGKNRGIVGNTNHGLDVVRGDYVGFMDHDDTLSPHALAEIIIALNEQPDTELFYSDEDKPTDDGLHRTTPFFKPDWNPELLLGVNYITHFVVAKKTLVDKVRGLREGFDGAQDYDFLLRVTEHTDNIVHIPKMLYHWRLAEGSTAVNVGRKDYATTAGLRALSDAVRRRKLKAEVVEIPDRPTNYRLRYLLPKAKPRVSIIIPFKDKVGLLKTCAESILTTNYDKFEVILLSNNSEEPETFEYLDVLKLDKRFKVHMWNHKFNYSAINNYGRTKARGEYLVFLNNDTEVLDPEWLNELVGVASQKQNGAVGPLLLYPDGRIQHAGVVLGMKTMAGHVFRLRKPEEWTDFGLALWPRNVLAVTGACLVVKAAKYDEVGGFDEELTIGGNDVALCLRLHEAGYRNVYWPLTRLTHFENISVGDYDSNVPIGDYNKSLLYYRPYLDAGDKYYNPNLDLMNESVGIGRCHEKSDR